jgi:hypothetical protein
MLSIDTRYQTTFAALELDSFDSVVALFGGDKLPAKTCVRVRPHTISPPGQLALTVFYKQYEYRPASWAFIGRASKARREYQNYQTLERLGIACAERVACGEQRDGLGRLRRAFIVTRAIPGAMNLVDFTAKHCPDLTAEPTWHLRKAILHQLAAMTRASHAGGFFHNDLYWRNVVVSWQPPTEPKVWWIDSPRGQLDRWSPLRNRRRIKDLAALDKFAASNCWRSERAAFVRGYLGKSRLDGEARQLIRETLAYRKQRWPEDWDEN